MEEIRQNQKHIKEKDDKIDEYESIIKNNKSASERIKELEKENSEIKAQ